MTRPEGAAAPSGWGGRMDPAREDGGAANRAVRGLPCQGPGADCGGFDEGLGSGGGEKAKGR